MPHNIMQHPHHNLITTKMHKPTNMKTTKTTKTTQKEKTEKRTAAQRVPEAPPRKKARMVVEDSEEENGD